MRYKFKEPIELGTERTITKFLLFPKCIKNEVRWLEVCEFVENYINVNIPTTVGGIAKINKWVVKEWVN